MHGVPHASGRSMVLVMTTDGENVNCRIIEAVNQSISLGEAA